MLLGFRLDLHHVQLKLHLVLAININELIPVTGSNILYYFVILNLTTAYRYDDHIFPLFQQICKQCAQYGSPILECSRYWFDPDD